MHECSTHSHTPSLIPCSHTPSLIPCSHTPSLIPCSHTHSLILCSHTPSLLSLCSWRSATAPSYRVAASTCSSSALSAQTSGSTLEPSSAVWACGTSPTAPTWSEPCSWSLPRQEAACSCSPVLASQCCIRPGQPHQLQPSAGISMLYKTQPHQLSPVLASQCCIRPSLTSCSPVLASQCCIRPSLTS